MRQKKDIQSVIQKPGRGSDWHCMKSAEHSIDHRTLNCRSEKVRTGMNFWPGRVALPEHCIFTKDILFFFSAYFICTLTNRLVYGLIELYDECETQDTSKDWDYHMTERKTTPEKRTRVSKPKTQKRKKRNKSRQNPNRCHIRCFQEAIFFRFFSDTFRKFRKVLLNIPYIVSSYT